MQTVAERMLVEAVRDNMRARGVRNDARALGLATGLVLDDWQERFIASDSRRLLLNASRQSGKTTATALRGLRTLLQYPGDRVAVFAVGERQAKIVLASAKERLRSAESWVFPAVVADSSTHIQFEDGSELLSLPATEATVRGIPGVRLLIVDEAAKVPMALYAAIRPMIAAVEKSSIIALSTPFGRRGWWSDAWHGEEPDAPGGPAGLWERWKVPATECPRITKEWLDEERMELGDWWFLQEYFCEFLDAETQAFSTNEVDLAFAEEVDQWDV